MDNILDNANSVKISLIVPLFNEEEVLGQSFERMKGVMEGLPYDYEIIYVDDGSSDKTWKILSDICETNDKIKGLRFSRNFGHQLAVTAGMDKADGDALVIIDADLQDPPEVIPEMIEKWKEGYEVVYGLRAKREGENALKKLTASIYYRFLRMMSAYEIPLDTGDFRLIDRKVADAIGNMREHNRYLRGMAAWAGFSQTPVEYVRHSRVAGKTHYTFKKMLSLAISGVLGFSDKPLMFFAFLGGFLSAATALGLIITAIVALLRSVNPWLFAVWILALLMSTVIFAIGVNGAYMARVHDEVRNRPLYIIRESVQMNSAKMNSTKKSDKRK